jgi:uncharacterized protein YjiS (DUF1127 family)
MIASPSRFSPSHAAGRGVAAEGLIKHALTVLGSWWRAHGDRRRLAALSDEMLRDVGLSRADVEREFQRPFWEPVDYEALDQQRAIAARRNGFGLP